MSCLSKTCRINNPREFNRIYKSGKSWHTNSFVAFFIPNENLNVAFVTSKKVGNAVYRNKARRRLKALFSTFENKIKFGSYIFVSKNCIKDKNFLELKRDFDFALKRLEVFL